MDMDGYRYEVIFVRSLIPRGNVLIDDGSLWVSEELWW